MTFEVAEPASGARSSVPFGTSRVAYHPMLSGIVTAGSTSAQPP